MVLSILEAATTEDSKENEEEKLELWQISNQEFREMLDYAKTQEGYTDNEIYGLRLVRAYEQLLYSRNLLDLARSKWSEYRCERDERSMNEWLCILARVAKENQCEESLAFYKEDYEMFEMLQDISNARENDVCHGADVPGCASNIREQPLNSEGNPESENVDMQE